MYDHIYNHIHCSGIQPLAAPPMKCSRRERNDPTGTAEKKARATQQHLDRLGKLASLAKTSLYQDHKGDFVHFARQCRRQQCLADIKTLPHPAGPFLENLQKHSMPVVLKTPLWTIAACNEAMQYGAHSAANDHKEFLRDKLSDMVKAGHWLVLPYSSVRHATDLQLSPLGVVPQRDRRPRPIADYTFSGVNEATVKLAPPESMQFGKALDRIIQKAADKNPLHGTVNLCKYNLADTIMRAGLSPCMILKLAVAIPTTSPNDDPLIAVPMVLPMGWMESPQTFCTVTETISDLANAKIAQGYILAPYQCHEAMANTMLDIPTMTECLQDSPDPHTDTGDACDTFITSTPTTYTTSTLYSPNQSTGMGDAGTTSPATLQQLAEEVVLHPTTTSSATCPGTAQLPLPTTQPFKLQTSRASLDNTGGPPLEYVDVFMDNLILLTQGVISHNLNLRLSQ